MTTTKNNENLPNLLALILIIILLFVITIVKGQSYATIHFSDDFTAGGTTLNSTYWTTASEIDNDYFTLERCEDNDNFIPIGIVNGNNGYSIQHYSYIDHNISKTYYYRLKQTDYNGTNTYFNVEVITIRNSAPRELKYVFDIQGKEVSLESKGVIIKIYSDGTAEKVGQ